MTARKTKTANKTTTPKPARASKAVASSQAGEGKKRRSTTPRKRRVATSEARVAPAPSHELIAREAFLIWEASGRPHGEELSHWLEAERRLASSKAA